MAYNMHVHIILYSSLQLNDYYSVMHAPDQVYTLTMTLKGILVAALDSVIGSHGVYHKTIIWLGKFSSPGHSWLGYWKFVQGLADRLALRLHTEELQP